MPKLLQIDSSGKGSGSVTRPLTKFFAEQWQASNRSGEVVYRDLMKSDLKFVDEETVGAYFTPEDKQTDRQKQALAKSNLLVDEILSADTIVIGTPMYNFIVPAVFKAYLDLVIRAGKTFSYESGTPKGLLGGKKLIIISSSGGDYSQPPMKSYDFVEPYLRAIFGFLGITDITYLTAPGRDPETIAKTSKAVQEEIKKLLAAVPVS
ncbi:unnamed protein product [Sphagnum balticum]